MKIRSDYVSNSSSSSFIVVLPKDYSLDKFIGEAVKSCSEKKEYDEDKAWVDKLDKSNRINLEYCLNNYKLLFIGCLSLGEIPHEVNGKEDCDYIRKCYAVEVGQLGKIPHVQGIIIANDDEHFVISEPRYESEVIVTENAMSYRFRPWNVDKETNDEKKSRVDEMVKMIKDSSDDPRMDYIHLYEITKDTIANTKELIEFGYNIDLPKWAKDLDAIAKRLEDGDRLFGIEMAQGGDGMSSGKIYALNGWESNFNEISDLEVLSCECG